MKITTEYPMVFGSFFSVNSKISTWMSELFSPIFGIRVDGWYCVVPLQENFESDTMPSFGMSVPGQGSAIDRIFSSCQSYSSSFGVETWQPRQQLSGNVRSSMLVSRGAAECHLCHRHYATPELLKRHMAYHQNSSSGQHQCHVCGKICAFASDLRKHIRIHTGEKPLQCSQCAFRTGDPSSLAKHVRKHHGSANVDWYIFIKT